MDEALASIASQFAGKAPANHSHSGYAPANHTHDPEAIGAAPASHTHDYAAPGHTHAAATTSAAGLMSASDKSKLNGIATGANKTTVDSALSSTSTNPVQNKVINSALAGKAAANHTHGADVITAHLEAVTYDAPVSGIWTNIPLTNWVCTGNGFTIVDNQIRVGAGISKVMISAQICVGSANPAGNKYFAIRKNASQDKARTQIRLHEAYIPETMCIPSLLVDVAEGDLLTIDYSGAQGDAIYGQLIFTYLTVQKIA